MCVSNYVVWVVRVGGSHTSILTPYLKSTGLYTPSVEFSSNSVQTLQRYYNIPAHSNVGMENLNLGIEMMHSVTELSKN